MPTTLPKISWPGGCVPDVVGDDAASRRRRRHCRIKVLRRSKRSTYWARWRSPRNWSCTRARPAAPSRSASRDLEETSDRLGQRIEIGGVGDQQAVALVTIWSWIPPTRLAITGGPSTSPR